MTLLSARPYLESRIRILYHISKPHSPSSIRYSSSIPNAIITSPHQSAEQHSVPRKRNVEPWINTESLKGTLEKHREANRTRRAVDGVPIEVARKPLERESVTHPLRKTKQIKSYPTSKHLALTVSSYSRDSKDYHGESRGLTWAWKVSTAIPQGLKIPWIRELESNIKAHFNVPASQRLNDEINACDTYLSPTSIEQQAAQRAYADIRDVITVAADDQAVDFELIGSRATGLANPLSDLDINLKTPKWQILDDQQRMTTLNKLYKGLKYPQKAPTRKDSVSVRMFLRTSAVPIIECVHVSSALTFQIQFSQSGYESLELTKAYVAEFPTLRSLYLVLKQILVLRGLSICAHGGLTSYPLLNMIATSLKIGKAAKDPSALGAQLLEFLDFFSEIDFYSTAIRYYPLGGSDDPLGLTFEQPTTVIDVSMIDPVTAQPLLKTIKSRSRRPEHLMSLQDPADMTNDLGRSIRQIKHVQESFIEARQQIRQAMAAWDQKHSRGLDMKIHGEPLLGWCLEGDYSQFEESRRTLRKYGI